ncbi:MAG: hypothetical protein ABIA04_07735 [Pseudomonadota bacterium]
MKKTLIFLPIILIVITVLLNSCMKKVPEYEFKLDPQLVNSSNYFSEFEKWTIEKKIYKNFKASLFITVTYLSWPYRKAYVKELASKKQMPLNDQARLIEDELSTVENYMEFFIVVYTHESNKSDFNKKESMWSIFLVNSRGERIDPIQIDMISFNTPMEKYFYPNIDRWSKVYKIRFENLLNNEKFFKPTDQNFKLYITGLEAKAEFLWDLQ